LALHKLSLLRKTNYVASYVAVIPAHPA